MSCVAQPPEKRAKAKTLALNALRNASRVLEFSYDIVNLRLSSKRRFREGPCRERPKALLAHARCARGCSMARRVAGPCHWRPPSCSDRGAIAVKRHCFLSAVLFGLMAIAGGPRLPVALWRPGETIRPP